MLENHPIFTNVKYRAIGMKQYIYNGSGSISMIPEICNMEGWKRILLVIDPGVLKAGSADGIINIVEEAGFDYEIFSEIKPNPLQEDIEKIGLPLYRKLNADVMIAIGGGSAMDSAKGIAMIGDTDLTIKEAHDKLYEISPFAPCPWETYPIIAIPTTAGTGSEVMRNAVISEPNGHKLVPMHDCITPAYAIEDPDLLATLPTHVAAATAMDALVQAIESYVSRAATDFSALCGLHAIELIGPNILQFVRNPADKEVADLISRGSMFSGFSWNGSFVGQIHACNHPITEILNISHGDSCAILLPWFVEWNGENSKHKFWKVHNAMYPNAQVGFEEFEIQALVEKLKKLNYDLNILDNLTMDTYVKVRGIADGCTDETCDLIIDSQFIPDLYAYPRRTSLDDMKKALKDVNRGKYIYKG
jgi:alcohol dehydrogenase class IV